VMLISTMLSVGEGEEGRTRESVDS
jgi:hypothetical protein